MMSEAQYADFVMSLRERVNDAFNAIRAIEAGHPTASLAAINNAVERLQEGWNKIEATTAETIPMIRRQHFNKFALDYHGALSRATAAQKKIKGESVEGPAQTTAFDVKSLISRAGVVLTSIESTPKDAATLADLHRQAADLCDEIEDNRGQVVEAATRARLSTLWAMLYEKLPDSVRADRNRRKLAETFSSRLAAAADKGKDAVLRLKEIEREFEGADAAAHISALEKAGDAFVEIGEAVQEFGGLLREEMSGVAKMTDDELDRVAEIVTLLKPGGAERATQETGEQLRLLRDLSQRKPVARFQPGRLEIAAIIFAAFIRSGTISDDPDAHLRLIDGSLDYADKLIAASEKNRSDVEPVKLTQ